MPLYERVSSKYAPQKLPAPRTPYLLTPHQQLADPPPTHAGSMYRAQKGKQEPFSQRTDPLMQ